MNLQALLPNVCQIAVNAGDLIESLYHASERVAVENKVDGSPVTIADKQADALICKALHALTPNIALLTEESVAKVPFETRIY